MKRVVALLLALLPFSGIAQNYQDRWVGHFSYVSIKDISKGDNKLYVAAENAVFTYDLASGNLKTISTINGLSGEFITAIHYSQEYGLLVIGYENGLIDIVKKGKENVIKVVDIKEKQTIPPDRKRINNFNEHNGNLYIATKYGISVYNLARLEFGDTYFIGNGGSQINVVQTTVQDPYIFAASEQDGMLRARVADDNLIDFRNWSTIINGGFKALENLGGELYTANSSNTVLRFTPFGDVTNMQSFSSNIQSFRKSDDLLTITTTNSLQVYSPGFLIEDQIRNVQGYDLNLFSGFAIGRNAYLGTQEDGLLIVPFGSTLPNQVLPNGPIRNSPFAMDTSAGELWVSFGETTVNFNPYPLSRYGVSHLRDTVWNNISYKELSTAVNAEPTDLMKVTINPDNPKEVFMSSFQKGLLKLVDEEPVILYDETNSPLERVQIVTNQGTADAGIRIFGSDFDSQGNLWFVQSKTDKGLIKLSPGGQFQKIDLTNILPNPLGELALTKLVISRENYIFFGSYFNGVMGYNPQTRAMNKISENAGNGNLPSANVRALALDAQNRLWIGTLTGLRVLYSPSSFFQDGSRPESQPIIILEDGVAQELLYQQSITDIEVDGSNNKWISTATSGVFYLSADGQETILRFTKDNSPLPTNNVQDIAIDPFTGIVYFATTQGLVAYKGTATTPRDNLGDLHAFPNPVRPGFSGDVTIDGLTARANVKITDITGNLVFETTSKGGSVLWDTTAFGKYKVRSGVYLILVTTDDFVETKVSKIMIIR
ncbi:T9SS type A sorting domain-containing protein [Aequorivita sp. H23M31]|uniref:T9SS type A sorting domain-containing protein n=1 Tax=Aequorivita ciconiae TaxID=2494375 RepID=A0A410G5B2_9FLAO|nr:two-component regulator propeller domain-containing protein [Aequorivita sp. H23M31]QAA82462.1 T9SS type A sorting domain-containing protein [Aequorivita sp. H23M31]